VPSQDEKCPSRSQLEPGSRVFELGSTKISLFLWFEHENDENAVFSPILAYFGPFWHVRKIPPFFLADQAKGKPETAVGCCLSRTSLAILPRLPCFESERLLRHVAAWRCVLTSPCGSEKAVFLVYCPRRSRLADYRVVQQPSAVDGAQRSGGTVRCRSVGKSARLPLIHEFSSRCRGVETKTA